MKMVDINKNDDIKTKQKMVFNKYFQEISKYLVYIFSSFSFFSFDHWENFKFIK